MQTPINTRDLRLQATSPRLLLVGSNYIGLSATTSQFKYGTDNVAQPTQSVVKATLIGAINAETVTFSYSGLSPAPTAVGNTVTILPDSITGDIATVTASLTFLGSTYTNSVTISKIYNQLVSRIQRPVDLITSANDGTTYTLPTTSNFLELYNGVVKVTSGITYGPATTTQNGLTVAINTTTGEITVSQASTDAWTTDSESFVLTATKGTISYSSIYTITKAKAGITGTSGAVISLTTTRQAFAYNSAGTSPSGTATVTASKRNITGTVYYEFLKNDISVRNTTSPTYIYTPQTTYDLMPDIIEVRARVGSTTSQVVASDILTIYGLKPGADSITGYLTNEASVVATDSSGTISSYGYAGTSGTFYVYDGTVRKYSSNGVVFSVVAGSETDITMSINTIGAYNVTSMSADSGYATLRAVYNGITIDKTYSIAKSKAGLTGSNATAYWLVTSTAAIQKNNSGVFNPTTVTVYGYSATGTSAPALYSGRFKIYENGSTSPSYTSDTANVNENTKIYTPSSSSVTSIKIELYTAGGTTTKLDEQTIPVVNDGTAGVNAITGLLSNTSATLPADSSGNVSSYDNGSTTMYVYNGTTDDSANWTYSAAYSNCTSSTASNNRTQTVNSLSAESATIIITASRSGYSNVVQTFTLTKARAGAQGVGVNAISGSLTNPAYTVTANSNGDVASYSIAGGTFKVYSGTTDITTGNGVVYTVFQKTTELSIAIDSSTGVYTIGGLTVDTGYATLRATYGSFTIDKIYSIAKSKAGPQGVSITGASGAASFLITTRSDGTSTAPTPSELTTAIGRSTPVQGDLATITYTGGSKSYKYTITGWVEQAAWITGDLIVSGTITANKITSGTITTNADNYRTAIGNETFVDGSTTYQIGVRITKNPNANTLAGPQLFSEDKATTPTTYGSYFSSSYGGAAKFQGGGSYGSNTVYISGTKQDALYIGPENGSHSNSAINITGLETTAPIIIDNTRSTYAIYIDRLFSRHAIYIRSSCTNSSIDVINSDIGNATAITAVSSGSAAAIKCQNSAANGGVALEATGKITATNNIIAYYSDDRLKTKLGVISNALEKLNTLSGFYYEPNETAQQLGYQKRREIGVSAQDVQKILPEIIHKAPIDDKYLTVDYERLIPLIIEAIKELNRRIK
jgi:hypothetical protein